MDHLTYISAYVEHVVAVMQTTELDKRVQMLWVL